MNADNDGGEYSVEMVLWVAIFLSDLCSRLHLGIQFY